MIEMKANRSYVFLNPLEDQRQFYDFHFVDPSGKYRDRASALDLISNSRAVIVKELDHETYGTVVAKYVLQLSLLNHAERMLKCQHKTVADAKERFADSLSDLIQSQVLAHDGVQEFASHPENLGHDQEYILANASLVRQLVKYELRRLSEETKGANKNRRDRELANASTSVGALRYGQRSLINPNVNFQER